VADLYVGEDDQGAEMVLCWAGADERLKLSVWGADEGADFWFTPEQAEQLGLALLEAVRAWLPAPYCGHVSPDRGDDVFFHCEKPRRHAGWHSAMRGRMGWP
jgi:hypothetical protein